MSADWDVANLAQNLVAFRRGASEPKGCGFFVTPHTVLTAHHVVSGRSVGERIVVRQGRRTITLTLVAVLPALDTAVLRSESAHPSWVEVDRTPAIGDELICLGYPSKYPDGDTFSARVEGVTVDGLTRWLKFKGGQVTEGFSGAPLFNLHHGRRVCGIVKSTRDARSELGGRAIPLASVISEYVPLREELWDLDGQSAERSPDDRADEAIIVRDIAEDILARQMVLIIGDALDTPSTADREHTDDFLHRLWASHHDRATIRERFIDYLRLNQGSPADIYHHLAAMPFSAVVSLHPNAACEKAFAAYRAIVVDEDLMVRDLSAAEREHYLLGGSALFGRGLAIDQRDRELLRERYTHLGRGLGDRLAMSSVLFLCCDFGDWRTARVLG
ncbi:MAG: serine protease [Actinobacteria bacterium]|nr:serine protease [Actinomycetota bacterium]